MVLSQLILFGVVFSVAMAVLHGYLGWRIIHYAPWSQRRRRWAWGALVASAVVIVASFFLRFLPVSQQTSDIAMSAGYVVLGGVVLTWSFVVIRDLAWVTLKGMGRVTGKDLLPADPDRRRALFNGLNVGVLGLSGAGAVYGYAEAKRLATVVDVDVPIAGLPDALEGFTVAQVSDIHIGPNIKGGYLRAVVEKVNALQPDLIAVTGDLVDGSVRDLAADVAPLQSLRSKHGTFFCTGNHEYYSDAVSWCAHLETLGLQVLNNRHVVVEHGGASLVVAGVTDHRAETVLASHRTDPHGCVDGAPDCDVRLLLAHQPPSIHEAKDVRVGPARRPFDLQLSGHTHGGQFIPWNLLVGMAMPVTSGLAQFDKTWIYVNQGTGYWGPPLRLGVPAEITRLRLVRG